MECGNNLDFLLRKLDENIVTMSKLNNLEKRIKCLETGNTIPTKTEKVVIERVDITAEDLQVRINEDSRNVLLKSPETVNDDTWVHVSSLVKEV